MDLPQQIMHVYYVSIDDAIHRSGLCLLSTCSVNDVHVQIVERTLNHAETGTIYKEAIFVYGKYLSFPCELPIGLF